MGVLEKFPRVIEEIAFNPDQILSETGDKKHRLSCCGWLRSSEHGTTRRPVRLIATGGNSMV
jgi:hypothetical protein